MCLLHLLTSSKVYRDTIDYNSIVHNGNSIHGKNGPGGNMMMLHTGDIHDIGARLYAEIEQSSAEGLEQGVLERARSV